MLDKIRKIEKFDKNRKVGENWKIRNIVNDRRRFLLLKKLQK